MLISGPDPDWAKQSAERTSNAINLFLNLQERKRTDRENERQRHLALLAEHPELADGEYGTKLLKKYGNDDPLSSMVMTIRHRQELEAQSWENGALPLAQAIGDEAGRRAGERDALSKMDDTVPTFGHEGPGLFSFLPVPGPNEEKQRRAAELEQAPDITQSAFEHMTPAQRTAALTWQARHPQADLTAGVKFEKGFDRTQLPAAQQGLRAVGGSAADQRKAARSDAGLEQSQAAIDKAAAEAAQKARDKVDERAYQEKKDADKKIQKEIDQKARDAFAEHMQTRSQTFQEDMANRRAGDKAAAQAMPEGSPWANRKERVKAETKVKEAIAGDAKKKSLLIPVNEQQSVNDLVMDVLDLPGYGKAKHEDVTRKVLEGYATIKANKPKSTPADIIAILRQQFEAAKVGDGQ